MTTHTIEVSAWLTDRAMTTPQDLLEGKGLESLYYVSHDMSKSGWSKVGTAQIKVAILEEKEMVSNKVAALKAELQRARADAAITEKRILGQIQSLLAITNEVQA